VTVANTTLGDGTGGLASNYSLTQPTVANANITTKALTATIAAASKVYDSTLTAVPVFTVATGLVGLETVMATGEATFNSKDVTTANLVTANSNALADGDNGGLASNYSLATGQTVAATISAKALTASGISANNKVVDTTPTATLSGTAALLPAEAPGSGSTSDGRAYTSDDVNLTGTGIGLFANATVGFAKPVTVSGFTLGGLDAANYSVAQPSALTADITALTDNGVTLGGLASDIPVLPVVPMAVQNVITRQMPVFLSLAGTPAGAGNPSTTLTVVTSPSINVTMSIGNLGSTLSIIKGGIRLPDVNVVENLAQWQGTRLGGDYSAPRYALSDPLDARNDQ
jgi:hypothetical protein